MRRQPPPVTFRSCFASSTIWDLTQPEAIVHRRGSVHPDRFQPILGKRDFAPLHGRWQAKGRQHADTILLPQTLYIGWKIQRLERAARLLTVDAARNQLMNLGSFDTEEHGRAYVASLSAAS